MRPLDRLIYLALAFGFVFSVCRAAGAPSEAPYFEVGGEGGGQAAATLPLKSSVADVKIEGTIAKVHLTQRYVNMGAKPIEAIYVFPASTRAAVHGMTLSTGGKVITAKIKESARAKEDYERAKSEKKTAALLQEHRPNVFQMSVANILPGDDIDVEIEWTETIPAVDSTYEFVFPTVVGPRYTGGSAAGRNEAWTQNPHLAPGVKSPTTFKLNASLVTTLPLAEVKCPSHPVKVDFQAVDRAGVKIDTKAGEEAVDRDLILRWKLGNEQVDAGLMLNQGAGTNHFLLQVAPPTRATPDQIPPRDYVMILDVSGSMNGFPLETAKGLLRDLVNGLRPEDTFNVVTFASGSGTLSREPLPANAENIREAMEFIDGQHSGGGTELEAALKRSLALPGGEGRSRSFLLITDGYVNVEAEAKELVRANIGKANLFTFGIGTSVNRELLEGLARMGQGEPVVVTAPAEAKTAAVKFREQVSMPVLAKVSVNGEGVSLANITPEPYPDVFANRPLVITGTWSGEPKGKIIVRGIGGNGMPFEKAINLADAAAKTGLEKPALPVLWARERVRALGDLPIGAESVREITSLGLSYSLLTPYTSFLAVDETPRPVDGVAQSVRQAAPLPKGVGMPANFSRGVTSGASVPEPGSVGLIAVLVVLLALQRKREPHRV